MAVLFFPHSLTDKLACGSLRGTISGCLFNPRFWPSKNAMSRCPAAHLIADFSSDAGRLQHSAHAGHAAGDRS